MGRTSNACNYFLVEYIMKFVDSYFFDSFLNDELNGLNLNFHT